MLWIAIDLPALALEASPPPAVPPEPWAVIDNDCVLVCNAQAQACGVRAGMRVTAACAIAPRLNCRPRNAAAEAAALDALAAWALQFTPNVSLEPPRALLLDIEGSLGIFGGIRALLQAVERGLADMGYSATLACAPTATAAWLLARAGLARTVHCKRALAEAVAALPLAALECAAHTARLLQDTGVKRVGDLLALPRAGVARRCGQPLLDTIDRALGRRPAPRKFFAPPARFEAQLEFPVPAAHGEALLFAARRLLNGLAGFLAARNGGVQRLKFLLRHEKCPATTVEIGLVAPTRDAAHLTLLARERFAAFTLPAPVCAIALAADDILELAGENDSFFPDRLRDRGAWENLVERLRARLGPDAVHGVAMRDEHRPERACRRVAPGTTSTTLARGPRPLWLFDTPRALAAASALPRDDNGPLALIAGPERIESGWWDNDDFRRDYFIAQSAAHSMLWVYRERRRPGGWYLHGVFG